MIGEEVRRQREQLGLTGAQLAARAGMAPSAVSQIENGKRTPSSTSVIKLAAALNVAPGDLYPKAQAPLPLEDAGQGIITEEAQATGVLYTEFEFFGRVLAQNWKDDLEEWDAKLPRGVVPDSFDFGRLLQWALDVGHARRTYEALARDPRVSMRDELADTLGWLEKAEREAFGLVKRAFEPAKTLVEFRRIWDANDLDAMMREVESR